MNDEESIAVFPTCPRCGSRNIWRNGKRPEIENGKVVFYQCYKCNDCKKVYIHGIYGQDASECGLLHFGVKLRPNRRYKITRESFSEPSDRISYSGRKYLKQMIENGEIVIPDKTYKDEGHYTKEFVEDFTKALQKNYDANMRYFNSLDKNNFQSYIGEFVAKNRFTKINDLAEVDRACGIYLMVLGEYKQVYIGISTDVKRRIRQHWQTKKEFDSRLFGTPANSILPIDSFGALDTTEIYFKKSNEWGMNDMEEKMVGKFRSEYLLNRVAGGINGEYDAAYRTVMLGGGARFRKMDGI